MLLLHQSSPSQVAAVAEEIDAEPQREENLSVPSTLRCCSAEEGDNYTAVVGQHAAGVQSGPGVVSVFVVVVPQIDFGYAVDEPTRLHRALKTPPATTMDTAPFVATAADWEEFVALELVVRHQIMSEAREF